MANEDKKDFNAMLNESKDMPKIQIITDEASVKKYGGNRMYFAPPADYDKVMKAVPKGKLITVGDIRTAFAKKGRRGFYRPYHCGNICFNSRMGKLSAQRGQNSVLAHP